MPFPATLLTNILLALEAAIAPHIGRMSLRAPMLHLLCAYLLRTVERLTALHARWESGTLPRPRPARARPARPHQAANRPRLPATPAWIVHAVGFRAANFASQLTHLLARPDLAEFLAAAPQAGRLLRPIARMLGTQLPPALTLPPRPPRPRRAKPAPLAPAPPAPEPEPRHGKYPPAAIRRYRPGPMPPLPLRPAIPLPRTAPA